MQTAADQQARGRVRSGTIAGIVAAAAVLGALVVFARRDGSSLFDPDVGAPVGGMLHLLITLFWAWLFAIVAWPYRGLRVLGVAFLTSLAACAISAAFLPAALRYGNGLYASTPRAAVVHLLLAVGLASGMRLARR